MLYADSIIGGRCGFSLTKPAKIVGAIVLFFTLFNCSQTWALDWVKQFGNPTDEEEKPTPQDVALQKILVAFQSVDVDDKDYSDKRYELFKKLFSECMRLQHTTPSGAAHYARAVTNAEAYYKRLLKEEPLLNKSSAVSAVVIKPPSAASKARPKFVIDPAIEEKLKALSPQKAALKRIQIEFESVDIDDQEYESVRFALFNKYCDEHIRLNGSTPREAANYTHAILRARVFYDILLKVDPRFSRRPSPPVSGPSFMSNDPVQPTAKAPPVTEKPNASDPKSPAKPAIRDTNTLKAYMAELKNHIKYDNQPGAKYIAQKIIDEFGGTPEAAEAKNVLQGNSAGEGQVVKPVPDSKPSQPQPAPVNAQKAKSQASMMRNYVNARQLDKAKEYAKKIIDGFPGTPEAEEAKGVLELK